MKEELKVFLKGILVGASNMVAGVSGATLAYVTGIYEDLITSLSNLRSKKSILYLLTVGMGVIIGLVLSAFILNKLVTIILLEILSLFFGFILGGVVSDVHKLKLGEEEKKAKYIIALIIPFIFVIGLSIVGLVMKYSEKSISSDLPDKFINYLFLFFAGFLATFAMLIPGISGSLIFMLLGVYYPILNTISSLVNFSEYSWPFILNILKRIIPTGLGIITSLIVMSKPIKHLNQKYNKMMLYIITGFVAGSLFAIYIVNMKEIIESFKLYHLFLAILVFLPLGYFLSSLLYKLENKKENNI